MSIKTSLIKKILTSKSFLKATVKAGKLLTQDKKLSELAIESLKKVRQNGGIKKIGLDARNKVLIASRMVYYYGTGKYLKIKPKSILIIIAVLLYFIMPIDLMPDFIPGLGLVDDLALLGWVFSTLSKEMKNFEEWYTTYAKAENIDFIDIQ